MEYPLVNGHRYSFSSIEMAFRGKRLMGFTSINYKQSLTPGEARGNHAQRLGTTRGELKASGDFEMFKEEGEELIHTLGNGYMELRNPVTVTWAEEGGKTRVDVLHNCRITDVDDSHSAGTDAAKLKFTIELDFIEKDGIMPLKKMLTGQAANR